MSKYIFTLFVYGEKPQTERTADRLRQMLDRVAESRYELSVCDVLKDPESAEALKILATPALVLTSPPPTRQLIGDLFDTAKVLRFLGGLFDQDRMQ